MLSKLRKLTNNGGIKSANTPVSCMKEGLRCTKYRIFRILKNGIENQICMQKKNPETVNQLRGSYFLAVLLNDESVWQYSTFFNHHNTIFNSVKRVV
jgi:hypothetical protein